MQVLLFALVACVGQSPDPEAGLLATLRSDAPTHAKAEACRQLAPIASHRAVPVLGPMLTDERLSHMARHVLEAIPDPSADAALRAALLTVKGPTRVGIIASLGVRKDAQAIGSLARLLADTDPNVAQAAARTLGSIGGTAPVLLKALPGRTPEVRAAIGEGLLRCAETASAARAVSIYDRLRASADLPAQVRNAALVGAIRARGARGAAVAIEALRAAPDASAAGLLRVAAAIPGATMTRALAAEIERASLARQLLLVEALGDRRDAAARPRLEALAIAGPTELRLASVRALAQTGKAESVPALIALTTDADEAVGMAARAALVGFPAREADAILVQALGRAGSKAFIALADVAAQRRVAAAVPALLRAAAGGDAGESAAGFRGLGELATGRDVAAMASALLRTGDPGAGEAALAAVCARQPDPPACADGLLPALAAAQGEPRSALLRVLGGIGGPKALEAVRAAARDTDGPARSAALRTLCDWPGAEALPDLIAIARGAGDSTTRVLALRGALRLTALPSVAEAARLEHLGYLLPLVERKDEAVQALAILSGMPDPTALQMVAPFLTDESVREEGGMAAVAIGEKLVERFPAETADALALVETNDSGLVERVRRVLERVPSGAVEEGFTPLFNGKDLAGWEGKPGWWTVEDGALTSESTPEKPCSECNYLIWRGGQPANFELRASFRLSSAANSGIQVRSEERPNWDTFGYQADMTGDGELVGFVYHHSRGLIAGRGESATFAADGAKAVEPIGDAAKLRSRFRPNRWNSYRIVCRGSEIALHVNGVLMCRVTDRHATQAAAKGIVALQMHPGPPMKVQFRNIRMRELK